MNKPTAGARFLLERSSDEGVRAVYRVAIDTPEARYEGTATLGDDGSVDLASIGAPGELESTLHMLAKLTARGAAKKREDGLPAWPQRILRWRR